MSMHQRTRRSKMYIEALKRARQYIEDPQKIEELLSSVRDKAQDRQGTLSKVRDQFDVITDLIRSYRTGEYRDVSNKSIMLSIAALLYFVMPLDFVPDILIGLGYVDDIALLAWTFNTLSEELDKFRAWRDIHRSAMGEKRARESRKRAGILIEGELVKD